VSQHEQRSREIVATVSANADEFVYANGTDARRGGYLLPPMQPE
jgi:hypothetical protein